jgi:hypothetical protein
MQAHVPWRKKLKVVGSYARNCDAALARDLAWVALYGPAYACAKLNFPQHAEVQAAIAATCTTGNTAEHMNSGDHTPSSLPGADARRSADAVTWERVNAVVRPWFSGSANAPRTIRGVTFRSDVSEKQWQAS